MSASNTDPTLEKTGNDELVGQRLELFRLSTGMTQARFAASIDVSPRSYHHYERGTRSISTEALRQLHDVYALNPNWVLLGSGLPREGEDDAALSAFIKDLSAHLGASEAVLSPDGHGKIVSLWFTELKDGRRVGIDKVRTWVDLLKE